MSNALAEREFASDWCVNSGSWIEIPDTRPQMRVLTDPVDVPEDFEREPGRTARFVPYSGSFDVL